MKVAKTVRLKSEMLPGTTKVALVLHLISAASNLVDSYLRRLRFCLASPAVKQVLCGCFF